MAYLYVPGLGASTSGSDLLNPHIEQSVMSRGRLMRQQYWSNAWKKGGWIRLLSGMILRPLEAECGVGSWISSLLDFPASPTQSPDGSKATKTSGISGPNSSESSGKSVPPWSSSKTSQNSLPGFDLSGRNYAQWVTNLRQDSTQRQKSAHPIKDSDYSSWRTPGASDGEGGVKDYVNNPKYRDAKAPKLKLRDQAAVWCTPKSRDWRSGKQEQQSRDDLNIQVHTLQDQKNTPFGTKSSKNTPRLNPLFVEWLMGLPRGWTALEPVETPSSPKPQP